MPEVFQVALLLLLLARGPHAEDGVRHARRLHHHGGGVHAESAVSVTSELLVALVNGSVFMGCDVAQADVEWRLDGVARNDVVYVRDEGKKAHNRTNESRLLSTFHADSQRHVLSIWKARSDDSGSWTCHALDLGNGNGNGVDPARKRTTGTKRWTLLVAPHTERAFVFASEEHARSQRRLRLVHDHAVVGVRESDPKKNKQSEAHEAALAFYCVVLTSAVRAKEAKTALRWDYAPPDLPEEEIVKLDVSAQSTAEHFVQNSDSLLGIVRVLKINTDVVNRSFNGGQLLCSSSPSSSSTSSWSSPSVSLRVSYPPTFTLRRTPAFGAHVGRGMTVALGCDVDAQPPAVPVWMRNEHRVASQNGTMVIEAAEAEVDTGWYQCSVVHEGEEYSSIAYFLNVLPSEEQMAEAAAEASGSVANETLDSAKRSALSSSPSSSWDMLADRVVVTEARHASDCNPVASVEDKQTPHFQRKNASVVPVIKGAESYVLAFEVCSNPRPHRIIWVTPSGLALRPGQTSSDGGVVARNLTRANVSDRPTCYDVALEVRASHHNILGEYVLVARNAHGLEDATVTLVAEVASSDRSTSAAEAVRAASVLVFLAALAARK